jgi:hypothetical protein
MTDLQSAETRFIAIGSIRPWWKHAPNSCRSKVVPPDQIFYAFACTADTDIALGQNIHQPARMSAVSTIHLGCRSSHENHGYRIIVIYIDPCHREVLGDPDPNQGSKFRGSGLNARRICAGAAVGD